ncbi:MAG: CPBP family intramembrane metalloprotease [Clostridia bacterium]|nr:CPBP family intramembrane metalloprotease [Clostridia bacterium]
MTPDTKIPKRVSEAIGGALLLAMLLLLWISLLPETEISALPLLFRIVLKIAIFLFPALWLAVFLKRRKISPPKMTERASLNKSLMLMLSSAGLIVIIEILYTALFPTVITPVGVARENTLLENFLLFLSVSVVPAVTEEIFFRGVVLRSMRVFRTSLAILMSALVFALMHFSAPVFPLAFVCGLIFGMAYVSTGSVFSVIGIHFLCNAFWFLAETVNVYMPDGYSLLIRGAFTVCVLLSSTGLPFLKENTVAFFADDEYAVSSSAVLSLPMMLFIGLAVGIQLFT